MENSRGGLTGQSSAAAVGQQSFADSDRSTLDQARSKIEQVKSTAEDRARTTANSGKSAAVDTLSGLAQSLSIAGQQLQDRHNRAGSIVSQAAERVDRMAQYLDRSDVNDLVRRSEDWARRNPGMFLGGAFVLGLLGARFLKASPPREQNRNLPSTNARGSTRFSDREGSVPVSEG